MYRPNPGFVGEDQFTIKHPEDVMAFYHVGPRSLVDVLIIKVLDTPSGAAPTAPRP